MEVTYEPWKLEIDPDGTKEYYTGHNIVENKEDNDALIQLLTEKQKAFFELLGVDLSKAWVEQTDYVGQKGRTLYEVRFLFRGTLKAIPSFQAKVYEDPEIFGEEIRKQVEVVETDPAKTLDWKNKNQGNNIDGMVVSFKQPSIFFDEETFQEWDCGYVCGIALLKKKQKGKKETPDLKIRREDMPSLKFGLHDVHIKKIKIQKIDSFSANVTFMLLDGVYTCDEDIEPIPCNILFEGVDLDFSNIYVMTIFGVNHGKIKGHKYSLKKFIKKYKKADIEIVDETYGYNQSKFSGYLYTEEGDLEIMIELYHVGGMYYLMDGTVEE